MKVLYLLDFPPFIEDLDGLTKIYYNLIKHMSNQVDVDILIVYEKEENSEIVYRGNKVKKVEKFFNVNNIFFEKIKFSRFQRIYNLLTFSYQFSLTKKQLNSLDKKYRLSDYDIIHTAHLSFLRLPKIYQNVIIGATDACSFALPNRTLREKLRKFFYRQIEYKISRSGAWIHTVTERDAKGYKSSKVFVIPNGVDTDKYKRHNIKKIPNSFVFHGNLDYEPNIDAIFYMNEVIKKLNLDYKLYIVGRGNTDIYKDLEHVVVVGEVEDISREISKYEYYLILMKSGTGIKNKILEAMSCECNVIANEYAVNGIEPYSQLKKYIYIINDINEIKDILNKPLEKINPREFIKKYHSWERFTQRMLDKYKEIISTEK